MAEERFNMFVGAVMSTLNKMSEDKKSKYEDIARVLMGSKAYLLFDFQTVIVDVSNDFLLTFADVKIHLNATVDARRVPKHIQPLQGVDRASRWPRRAGLPDLVLAENPCSARLPGSISPHHVLEAV